MYKDLEFWSNQSLFFKENIVYHKNNLAVD